VLTRYDTIGRGYGRYRIPDPRIAARIADALGEAETVLNVGAGTGSYEPTDRRVVAVEPSATMIAQRPAGAAPVVQARAEALPFPDGAFDAAMAVLTVHHWSDWRRGIAELTRVARSVVILTWDPAHEGFWLTRDYFPDFIALDRAIFPPLDALASALGGADAQPVLVPGDCADGFLGAYWRRPHAYLDAGARGAISSFARIDDGDPRIRRLAGDLDSGRWHDRYGHLLSEDTLDVGYRLVVRRGAPHHPPLHAAGHERPAVRHPPTPVASEPIAIARADLAAPESRALIDALNAELRGLYPEPGANHFRLDPEEVAGGRGAFLLAYRGRTPVGCGALRLLDAETAELKRMYVAPSVRGAGLGRRLVDALEAEARALGARRLVLETGVRQLPALALYRATGFSPIPLYGEYGLTPDTSVCLGKELVGQDP
jgi:GNAT superfamily N-acetyltransferase